MATTVTLGRGLAPRQQRAPHVIRRADEQDAAPAVPLQNPARAARRSRACCWPPASRTIASGGTPLATASAFMTSASLKARHLARREDHARRVARLIEIDRLLDALLVPAAGSAGFADAAGKHDDGVGRLRRARRSAAVTPPTRRAASGTAAGRAPPRRRSPGTRGCARRGTRGAADPPSVPCRLLARSAPRSMSACMRSTRRSQLFSCATLMRRSDAPRRRCCASSARTSRSNPSASAATRTMSPCSCVEAANLAQVGRDDRTAHRQVLVQLRRDTRSRCTR